MGVLTRKLKHNPGRITMKNGSYFIPREQIYPFMNPGAMNNEEGLYLFWETNPETAQRILPPPLSLADPKHPIVMAYVVNIREPSFAPWYMEGGIGILCSYGDITGIYFLNLQLSGPGALTGLCSGREFSVLPKKICERIVVERTDHFAHAYIESKGKRIFKVEIDIGSYNDLSMEDFHRDKQKGAQERGSCLLFRSENTRADDGRFMFSAADLVNYDTVTDYLSWEPAKIESIIMEPSLDDPWAELSVVKLLGAAYSINSNRVLDISPIARIEGNDADNLFSYLFTGRWDRSTICTGHQRYGQF